MLAIDTEARHFRQAERQYEDQQAQVAKWIAEQTELGRFNDDDATSPLNTMSKLGKPMRTVEFEKRLAKLNPNLVFQWGIARTTHKWMCAKTPEGALVQLFVYPADQMPERSMWRKRQMWAPDPRYTAKAGDVDWADWEWVPVPGHETWHKSDGWKYPDSIPHGKWQRKDANVGRAGWQQHTLAWGEAVRGWRTCLVRLVQDGFLTVSQVEKEFLSDNTPEWARHTGKKSIYRPW
jgi:hypothetical protein